MAALPSTVDSSTDPQSPTAADWDDMEGEFARMLAKAQRAADAPSHAEPIASAALHTKSGDEYEASRVSERSEENSRETETIDQGLETRDKGLETEIEIETESNLSLPEPVSADALRALAAARGLTIPSWEESTTPERVAAVRTKDARAAYLGALTSHGLTLVNHLLNDYWRTLDPERRAWKREQIVALPDFPTVDDIEDAFWDYLHDAGVFDWEPQHGDVDGRALGLRSGGLDVAALGIAKRGHGGWRPTFMQTMTANGHETKRPTPRRFEHVHPLPSLDEACAQYPDLSRRTLHRDLKRESSMRAERAPAGVPETA